MSAPLISSSLPWYQGRCVYCSCSAEYIGRCSRMGDLAYIKKGRCLFFATADLDAWMLRDREPAKAA